MISPRKWSRGRCAQALFLRMAPLYEVRNSCRFQQIDGNSFSSSLCVGAVWTRPRPIPPLWLFNNLLLLIALSTTLRLLLCCHCVKDWFEASVLGVGARTKAKLEKAVAVKNKYKNFGYKNHIIITKNKDFNKSCAFTNVLKMFTCTKTGASYPVTGLWEQVMIHHSQQTASGDRNQLKPSNAIPCLWCGCKALAGLGIPLLVKDCKMPGATRVYPGWDKVLPRKMSFSHGDLPPERSLRGKEDKWPGEKSRQKSLQRRKDLQGKHGQGCLQETRPSAGAQENLK